MLYVTIIKRLFITTPISNTNSEKKTQINRLLNILILFGIIKPKISHTKAKNKSKPKDSNPNYFNYTLLSLLYFIYYFIIYTHEKPEFCCIRYFVFHF